MSWKSFFKGVGNFALGLVKSIPVVGNVFGAIENAVTAGKSNNLEDSSSSGWASTLSGAIPGLVDAGTTMFVNNLSKRGDINSQKELMSYQDALQDENYERELADKKALIADDRAYNDIGSQMARADKAGVSPLAALGVSSGNSISAQAPSHGGVSGHHVANNLLATISTLKGLQMQKELNDAQVYRTRQAGKLDEQKAETEVYNTIMAKLQSETYNEETKARIREMLKRGDLAGAQRELAIAETETENEMRYFNKMSVIGTLRKINNDIENDNIDISIKRQLADAEIELKDFETQLKDTQNRLSSKQIEYLTKEKEKLEAEIKKLEADTKLSSTERAKRINDIIQGYLKVIAEILT